MLGYIFSKTTLCYIIKKNLRLHVQPIITKDNLK